MSREYKQAIELYLQQGNYKDAIPLFFLTIEQKPKSDEAEYSKNHLIKIFDEHGLPDESSIPNNCLPIYHELCERLESNRKRNEEQQKQKEFEHIKNELLSKGLILSTCPTIEGYTIEEQMGLVFGEVFFKSSLSNRLNASLDNFGSTLKISATEMSGTVSLVEEAREYALKKLQFNAAEKGANAVIGIDAESTFGGDVMHVTIYGTAVKIVKNTL